jgi:hypothetical protein
MRSPVLAEIIGALRAWTVAMISALSLPWREIDVTPRLVCPLDDIEWDALVGELNGVGVAELVRGETAPHPSLRGDAAQLGAGGVAGPRPAAGRAVDHPQQRTDRHRHPELEPRPEVLPAPTVHADLPPPAALAAPDEHRSGSRLEVVFGDAERFGDAQPRSPEQHDQRRFLFHVAATEYWRWRSASPRPVVMGRFDDAVGYPGAAARARPPARRTPVAV